MKRPSPKRWILLLAVLCVALLGACYLGRELFTRRPFEKARAFDGPSGVFAGENGRVFVIDESKKAVLLLDEAGRLTRVLQGGADSDDSFFYASLVAQGADGSIYLADARYAGKGTLLKQERIFRYDAAGKNPRCIYTIDYEGDPGAPMQYGNIQSLREIGGALVFTVRTASGLDVRTLEPATGEVSSRAYALPNQYLSASAVDPDTLLPVFTNRFGQVCAVEEDGAVTVLRDGGRTAWMLCVEDGALYYTDLAANAVLRYDLATGREEAAIEAPDILYTAQAAGGRLYSTDYMGFYVREGGAVSYVSSAEYTQPLLRAALWVALFLGSGLALAVLGLALFLAVKKRKSILFQRVLIVLSVSLCVGVLVGYSTISQMVENQNRAAMEQLNLFDDILVEATNVEALGRVRELSDYYGADYLAVKEPLDALTDKTYENGQNYYYILYVADETTIYVTMDYEETSVVRHPVYAWGTEGYTDVFATGEPVEFLAETSSYGAWSFVIKPVLDSAGNVVAAMEVGVNLDAQNSRTRALVWNVVFGVLSMAVVLLMVVIETLMYAEHRGRRAALPKGAAASSRFPLRALAFVVFLADCMQDPFVSILADRLYEPFWGIAQGVGAALPLSAQVLFAALSAFACGSLVRRTGVKRMLTLGLLLQMAGFLFCGLFMHYFGLLLGKSLIGVGFGALLVCMNSVAAAGESEDETAAAFTAINAGTLAGITVGAGIGSIILSFSSFSMVYYVAALILAIGLLLAVFGEDYREPAARKKRERMHVFRFLANRSVWTFLLLLLMPFLIAISYREYFFPLYAAEMGITETDIGRIYLLCGLVVIYLGPVLTKVFVEKLGGKWTAVLASALMIVATLLFSFLPTPAAAVAGLLLLSIAISFGYAAQSTYFASLPQVRAYGESRAMGSYSLFDNGGQTLGPVVYGMVMMGGYQRGVGIIGVALLALLGLFLLSNMGGKAKHMKKGIVEEERRDDVAL